MVTSDARKPGVEKLLIAAALDSALAQRLTDSPDEVFAAFELTEEEEDILRRRDGRLLALLGQAVKSAGAEQGPRAHENVASIPPIPPIAGFTQLPDMRLVLTVVPVLLAGDGPSRGLTFAAWVTPLADGADADSLPAPDGVELPGQPLAPLRAIVQVTAQQLPDSGGVPQVGLSAMLLRSSNMSAPAAPQTVLGAAEADEAAAPDIWIVGLGIVTAGQLTREVEQAIHASREVLYLDAGAATRPLLESFCPRVTSLYDITYGEEQPRESGYGRAAECVIAAALDHPPVTFALHGHPLIAAHPPFLVMERARELGLRVRVLAGVSAIGTVLADLRIDPVVGGMQMYEATDLLLRRRPLQPDVPALIWQIGPLETCLHSMRVSGAHRFERFVAHLSLFYPPRHEMAAVYSPPHPLLKPRILRFALEDMGSHAAEIHSGFTLYIPPVASRPIQDQDLLQKLSSVEHLRNITGG